MKVVSKIPERLEKYYGKTGKIEHFTIRMEWKYEKFSRGKFKVFREIDFFDNHLYKNVSFKKI